jgi:hypothetical protein
VYTYRFYSTPYVCHSHRVVLPASVPLTPFMLPSSYKQSS